MGTSKLTRRDLFGLFRNSAKKATSLPTPLRPPGAIAEADIAQSCVRCGACIDVCPRQAIKPLPREAGDAAETPYIVPREAPCVLCNGLLCTTVCPSGTLRPVESVAAVRMGTAAIAAERCLPFRGQPCSTCVFMCPVRGALTTDDKGRPQVTSLCTGCGVCEFHCPTQPSAIQVVPRGAR